MSTSTPGRKLGRGRHRERVEDIALAVAGTSQDLQHVTQNNSLADRPHILEGPSTPGDHNLSTVPSSSSPASAGK